MTAYLLRTEIEMEIADELARARSIHGKQDHLPDLIETGGLNLIHGSSARANCQAAFRRGNGSWAHILHEEFGEAIDEARAGNADALREELIQVAAMCIAWVEAIDGRAK